MCRIYYKQRGLKTFNATLSFFHQIEEKIATYKKQQEIKCNFCGQSFLGMFCLRNHQRLCSGAIAHSAEIKAETEKVKAQPIPCHVPILRKKRKHKTGPVVKQPRPRPGTRITLPLQAKGILQKWLFAHRDVSETEHSKLC